MGDIKEEILRLKKERQAIVLAHSYQPSEIQDVADYVGDSLGLSKIAVQTPAKVIVFCGVHFMAQTAKILSPQKTVLLPALDAKCPMADMITAKQMIDFKARHPGLKSICYVNTTAEVKAECDFCCTSANAKGLTAKLIGAQEAVLFVPDKNLAHFVAKQAQRETIPWEGCCPIHDEIKALHIQEVKEAHPRAVVIAHPECPPATLELADMVTSTEGMIYHSKHAMEKEFIIATEIGIMHRLRKECPYKIFYPAKEDAVCEDMKKTTLEMLRAALAETKHVIEVEEAVAAKARRSLDAMMAIAGD